MTFMIYASKSLAISLQGRVVSNPYLAPAVFKEMSSAFFSMGIGSLSIIVITSVVFSCLLSRIEVSILPWTSIRMPSVCSALTDFAYTPLENKSPCLADGALNATVFLCPTLCPVSSSNLCDCFIDFCLSLWLCTMMKQSSNKLPASAHCRIYTCLLIHIAIRSVTLFAAPEDP